MAQGKVRCVECGAKNADDLAERCRICMGLLPDAAKRRADRLRSVTDGPAFNVIVEGEVVAWQELERKGEEGPKSRRPDGESEDGHTRRWGRRRSR